MSRKRALLEKQQRQRETLIARLEALDGRGADEEIVALAAKELPGSVTGELAERWAAVAEHVARRALAAADFERLSRLLPLAATSRRPPLVALAAAVVDLAAGRTETARQKLDTLSGEIPAGELLPALLALAEHPPLPPEVERFFLALRKLETARGIADTRLRKTLRRALESLRQALPADEAPAVCLLDGAGRCLDLLDELSALETRLTRPAPKKRDDKRRENVVQTVQTALQSRGTALAAALGAAAPGESAPLLAPLRHAVRLRWRAVLEAVAARKGSDGLLALATTRPELVSPELELPAGGLAGSVFQQARRVRTLLDGGQFHELAGLLHARARGEKVPSELAALWSLELWAMDLRRHPENEDEEASGPGLHDVLERIEAMALEIGRRFPAELRAEVARGLRRELLELCVALAFCEHTAGAASALLDHLEGDAGLLIAGIAGAIVGGDGRCERALTARLARRGVLLAPEREGALRLMDEVALVMPPHLARSLEVLRPLFAHEDWPEISERVAREMAGELASVYRDMGHWHWLEHAERPLERALLRRDLELLRPALGTTQGFAAIELTFDCLAPDGPNPKQRVRAFLKADAGYDTALIALDCCMRVLDRAAREEVMDALRGLADATLDRLDERWPRWLHAMPALLLYASRVGLERLEKTLARLLATLGLDAKARERLENALYKAQTIGSFKRTLRPPGEQRKPPGRRGSGSSKEPKPARRRKRGLRGGFQLDLDFC